MCLSRVGNWLESQAVKLEEVTDKLGSTEEQVEELCAMAEAWHSAAEDCWQLEESERTSELMLMRVKADIREEVLHAHEQELESWDYFI